MQHFDAWSCTQDQDRWYCQEFTDKLSNYICEIGRRKIELKERPFTRELITDAIDPLKRSLDILTVLR